MTAATRYIHHLCNLATPVSDLTLASSQKSIEEWGWQESERLVTQHPILRTASLSPRSNK